MSPDKTCGPSGWSANSNEVTTPKLPPRPRNAQKRSGCSVSLARMNSPSDVTTSAERRLSTVSPNLARGPAEAAAEREAGDAGRRVDAERGHEAERLRFAVEICERCAGLDTGGARDRVDAHRPHQ